MTRYLFTLTDGGGTVPPELGAARRLVERGHAVTVLGEDSMAAEVAASGARFRAWTRGLNRPDRRPEHAPYREWELRDPRRLVAQLVEHLIVGPAAGYAEGTAAAIDRERPDLVVASFFAVGAMVAAQARGVPFDVLIPNVYPLPAPGLPPFGPGLRPAAGPAGRLRDAVVGALAQRMWDRHMLPGVNALRGRHGLAPLRHYQDQLHQARRELILTSAAFDLPARLPPGARYVGPVLDDPAWAEDADWEPPPGAAPLVLVALSSTFQGQVECLQRVVDALAGLPVRGLVTTGPAVDPGALRPSGDVTVVAAAPHRAVLRHAALVVTHGGHGTLVKALAAGVPAVVLPHGRDQADNAARVVHHGAGASLPRTARPQAIARAVRRVLDDPAHRRAASALGAAIRRDAASGALVRELESVDDHADVGLMPSAGRRPGPAAASPPGPGGTPRTRAG
jgi:UDP:flavonoid glycosyltransferase YjiC (YdhE family)